MDLWPSFFVLVIFERIDADNLIKIPVLALFIAGSLGTIAVYGFTAGRGRRAQRVLRIFVGIFASSLFLAAIHEAAFKGIGSSALGLALAGMLMPAVLCQELLAKYDAVELQV